MSQFSPRRSSSTPRAPTGSTRSRPRSSFASATEVVTSPRPLRPVTATLRARYRQAVPSSPKEQPMDRPVQLAPPPPRFRRACLAALFALVTAAPSYASSSQDCSKTSIGQHPLDDLAGSSYLGVEGGLYPGGTNVMPDAHLRSARTIAKRLQPLGPHGNPDTDGIVG